MKEFQESTYVLNIYAEFNQNESDMCLGRCSYRSNGTNKGSSDFQLDNYFAFIST